MRSEIVLGLPEYEISDFGISEGKIRISARYLGVRSCPHCGNERLRNKGRYKRRIRHEDWGLQHGVLELEACQWKCRQCGRYFRDRFPGILLRQRSSEAFQKMIYRHHLDGINRSRLGRREGIGAATVERYFQRGLRRQFGEWHAARCPQLLGINEHFSPTAAATPPRYVICGIIRSTMSCWAAPNSLWRPIFSAWKAKPRCG